MCGIAGVLFVDERSPGEIQQAVAAMCDAQSPRGPDGAGLWSDRRVGLGAVRLAITGGAAAGSQPLRDAQGGISVFNGEVYNAAALGPRSGDAVEGGDFSDGPAVVGQLSAECLDGLGRVRGPFALARFDPLAGRLLLVRDAVGKKPLYVMAIAGGWAFASTLRALRVVAGPLIHRQEAIYEYLVYRSVGGHGAVFQGVSQVPPGGWVELTIDGRRREGRWWGAPAPTQGEAESHDVREAVAESILLRHTREHSCGIFLSGGLDSSIVAATLASAHGGEGLWTMSIGYDVPGREDETDQAAALSAYVGLPHERITLYGEEVPSLLEEAGRLTEDPIQDPVTLPTVKLARAASRKTKVVFTGDGSDEVWGGYERFEAPPAALEDYLPRTTMFTPVELGLPCPPETYLEGIEPASHRLAPLDRILRLEVSNRMRNYHLARIDKICMGMGLEPRSPFLDVRVVMKGLSIPASVKRPNGVPKGLLIDAFRDLLPEWLVQRAKQPFSMPIGRWLAGSLYDFAHDVLRAPSSFVDGFVDPRPYLAGLARGGVPSHRLANQLWSLLQLESWYQSIGKELGARS